MASKPIVVYYRRRYKEYSEEFDTLDEARGFIENMENKVGGYAYRVVTPDRIMFRELIRDIPTVKWIEEMNGRHEYRETI